MTPWTMFLTIGLRWNTERLMRRYAVRRWYAPAQVADWFGLDESELHITESEMRALWGDR